MSVDINRWWANDPAERFWLEITDRDDIGADLHIPQTGDDGTEFWGYSLIKEVNPGDVIFHWDKRDGGIVGQSEAIGEVWEAPVVWGARGTSARTAGVQPYQRPGWWLALTNYNMAPEPLTLANIRTAEGVVRCVRDELQRAHGDRIYFPFAISDRRPLRPAQGYLTKFPAALTNAFNLAQEDLATQAPPGRRTPPWSRDELILALDLYLRHGQLDDTDSRVEELSQLLNALPLQPNRPDAARFRNPNGVAMKLANFAALDPRYEGVGLSSGGRMDAVVWDEFAANPHDLQQLAARIREGHATPPARDSEPDEDETAFPEGRIIYRLHRRRERNPALIAKKKRKVMRETGRLECEACGFDFREVYGSLGNGFIECHHTVPLSETGEVVTRVEDLVLVCSNCHRMVHRRRPWLSVEDIRSLLNPAV